MTFARKASGKTETLYIRLLRNTKQCQWLLRQLQFQCHNCCSQTQHGASTPILEGKPGSTEGGYRLSLLESRKLFASNDLLSWRLSAQPVDYGISCIPSPSLLIIMTIIIIIIIMMIMIMILIIIMIMIMIMIIIIIIINSFFS